MAREIRLPPGIVELVKATGQPQTVTGIEFDNGAPVGVVSHVVFLDDGAVRSVPEAEWPAEQARLAQEEADRQQAAQVRAQVIQAYGPMVGRLVTANFTARELQAWLVVITHKLGGVGRDGSLLAPGDWET